MQLFLINISCRLYLLCKDRLLLVKLSENFVFLWNTLVLGSISLVADIILSTLLVYMQTVGFILNSSPKEFKSIVLTMIREWVRGCLLHVL